MDALLPPAMAEQAEEVGVRKANLPVTSMLVLAVLAGAFIAFGALFSTTVITGAATALPYGLTRLLAGISFSLGLILVSVGGAELFTGNNLIVMAWANRRIQTSQVLRNWGIVYLGNFAGAFAIALLVTWSGHLESGSGAVKETAIRIARAKVELGFFEAFWLGVLGNTLVCLAVWMTYSARSTADRILAIIPPVTAFVAAGFEHSIANMYFVPVALLNSSSRTLSWEQFLVGNLLPVTLGNIVGGSVFVGAVYWFVYLRKSR